MKELIIGCLLSLALAALCPHPAPAGQGTQDTNFGQNGFAFVPQTVAAEGDPCDRLPNSPGGGNGIDKKCPATLASSSGIAKADFNGDGYADLAIGVPRETVSGLANSGAVHVIYGSFNGLTTATSGIPLPQTWNEGNTGQAKGSGAGFGKALAAGDFNGDGYSDLAILVPNQPFSCLFPPCTSEELVVLYGSANGLQGGTNIQTFDPCPGDPPSLAVSLAWGDVDGDGTGDLLTACDDFTVTQIKGKKGSGLDLSTYFAVEPLRFTSSDVSGLQFSGPPILIAGDFNGDGRTDVAMGLPDTNLVDFFGNIQINHFGVVAVTYSSNGDFFTGRPPGLDDRTTQIWRQGSNGICCHPGGNAQFGAALAAGDFNGDGKQDLAVGLPGGSVGGVPGAGAVVIINGSSGGLTSAGTQIWNENQISVARSGYAFGLALASNDFNGDGRADLAIGIPFESVNGIPEAGQVDVIYGSASGLSTSGRKPQIWNQPTVATGLPASWHAHYGSSLSAWNFGRTEVTNFPFTLHFAADLAIGAEGETVSGVLAAGMVNVLYGSYTGAANGLTSGGNQVFTLQSFGIVLGPEHFGSTMY